MKYMAAPIEFALGSTERGVNSNTQLPFLCCHLEWLHHSIWLIHSCVFVHILHILHTFTYIYIYMHTQCIYTYILCMQYEYIYIYVHIIAWMYTGHSRLYVSCQPSDHVEAKTNSSPQRRTQRARDPPRKRKVSFHFAIYEIHKHGNMVAPLNQLNTEWKNITKHMPRHR